MRLIRCWLLVSLVLGCAHTAYGQATVDPTIAEFDPSSDHDAVVNGVAVVQRYDLEFYLVGGSQPTRVVSLGKPNPDSDGVIRVNFLALLTPPLTAGITYEARVVAVGPGGVGRSTPSNTFLFQPTCSTSISPSNGSVPAGGGPGSFTVNAPTGCPWSAVSNVSWIMIGGTGTGNGTGTVNFTVAVSSGSSQRSGTITVDDQNFTVTQAGTCSYSVAPASRSLAATATSSTFGVTTTAGCAWTATTPTSWISITSGPGGTGSGTVSFSVGANTGAQRNGSLLIAGQNVSVSQAGSCSLSVSPSSRSLPATGGSSTFAVTTATGCPWSATTQASWIQLNSPTSGNGNGTVSFTLGANMSAERSGTIVIGGHNVTVTQPAGTTCTPTVSPKEPGVPRRGGTVKINVTSSGGCKWSAAETPNVSWVSIMSGATGTGSGTVTVQVTSNSQPSSREMTLTIAGRTVTLTQSALGLTTPVGLRIVR
jgi:hypothetical protein